MTLGKASIIMMDLSLGYWATLRETGKELELNHQMDHSNFKLELMPNKRIRVRE